MATTSLQAEQSFTETHAGEPNSAAGRNRSTSPAKRGRPRKEQQDTVPVLLRLDSDFAAELDEVVRKLKSNRTVYIRMALRAALDRYKKSGGADVGF